MLSRRPPPLNIAQKRGGGQGRDGDYGNRRGGAFFRDLATVLGLASQLGRRVARPRSGREPKAQDALSSALIRSNPSENCFDVKVFQRLEPHEEASCRYATQPRERGRATHVE
jgi:hypothetical protein